MTRRHPPVSFALRQALTSDIDWMAELRAEVMADDLRRLGRFDPVRVRERFRAGFDTAHTWVVLVDGTEVGLVAARPADDGTWIEHFYLASHVQGAGLGGAVLMEVLGRPDGPRPFRLNVLQGSPARRLYERHGFVLDHEDSIDVFLVRP